MDILGLIRRLPEIVAYNKFDDDFFDRLNYSHTVVVLTVFAIIVTNRQFSENQIKCWVPAQFTGNYEQYVNQICFITNTYSFELHESLPDDDERRHDHELKYYQWTPFILLIMAIMFYVPHQLWRALSLRSGVDIKDLIEAAQTYRSANMRNEDKIKLLEYVTNWLNSYCSNSYLLTRLHLKQSKITRKAKFIRFSHHILFPIGIYTGNYFNNMLFICRSFWIYGVDIIHKYWTKDISLLHTGNDYFPKVVFCDFTIREPNHPKESHRYTVQCVLPFNLFNQQIFTYLYFWLIILSCFNFISIVMWLYRMSPYYNFRYLERRLAINILSDEKSDENDMKKKFVYRYLQGDGTFMLRLVAANVSDYVCRRILSELYKVFHESLKAKTIGREPLFQPILTENQQDQTNKQDDNDNNNDNDNDNDDNNNNNEGENTEQTNTVHIPPIPNPRQGRIYVERDITLLKIPSDISDNEQNESEQTDSNLKQTSGQIRLRSSQIPLLKDIRRTSEIQIESPEPSTPRYKNIDFHSETEVIQSSSRPSSLMPPQHPPPPPPLPAPLRGPTPYATTYLSTKKRNEHELPYIDDSISTSSTSSRLISATVVQQSEKTTPPKTTLASTNIFFRRSHDV